MVSAGDKHYTARILERHDLSEDLWVIRVDPGGPFQFKAGQYVTLGVDHGDRPNEVGFVGEFVCFYACGVHWV